MRRQELASRIDHTFLRPEATPAQVDAVCDEAVRYACAAVCVNPSYVWRAARRVAGTGVRVASVVGFPLGAATTAVKVLEARIAIDDGASEIDTMIHLGELIAGERSAVRDDVAAVAHIVRSASEEHVLKVIIETAALSEEQIIAACRCCAEAGADYVKTSTGFHPAGGATVEAVRLLHRFGSPMKVKAAGGIRDLPTALAMLEAGADRLGMSATTTVLGQLFE